MSSPSVTEVLSYTQSPHVSVGSTSVFKSEPRDHILPAGFSSTLSGAHWSLCSEPGPQGTLGPGPQRRDCHPQPGQRCVCMCAKSLQLCPNLCKSMDSSLPGSSVHGILQARFLEWVVTSSSRGPSQPRDPFPKHGGLKAFQE